MITIPMKRYWIGWMLAVVVLAWLFILILYVRGLVPDDSLVPVIGFGIACVALGWLFFGHHTVMTVGDGHLTVPSWFGCVRIPVAVIQHARVVRIREDTFLEVCLLREVPETLRPCLNTFMKRRMLAALKHISYRPPAEPYLLLWVMQPDCDDTSLMHLIDTERQALFQDPTKAPA